MPEKIRGDELEGHRHSKRINSSISSIPTSDSEVIEHNDLLEQLRQARDQVAKLERMNQSLARNAHRSEQAQQRQEIALSLIHEHGSDVMLRLGKDLKIRFVSSAGAAALGMAPAILEGRLFTDLTPSEDRANLRGFLQEILRAEKVERTRLRIKAGPDQHLEMDCFFQMVPHPQTQSPELLVLARRVPGTPERVETSLGELGARLAHELSQPLTAIGTTSRVCARHLRELLGVDHEITQATEQMADQSERANELIRRLRQLSTGSAPHRSSVDLNELVEETVGSLAGPIRQSQAPVILDLANEMPLVQADSIQLEQVLLNLIRNGLEAMSDTPSGQRQLIVRTRVAETEIEVSIADTGMGISSSMVEKLFQPYHTTKPHGMGLGLALCRSILQAHQGRLWVKGNHPRGAIFYFALPISQ